MTARIVKRLVANKNLNRFNVLFQILLVVIVNLKALMFPLLTAAAVVIQYYEDLEILKLLVRLEGNRRVHASVGGSNVSKVTEYGTWWRSRPS